MAKNLSRMEERRGTGRFVVWGIVIAILIGLGLTLGLSFTSRSLRPRQTTRTACAPIKAQA